jgi:hypothetical protein
MNKNIKLIRLYYRLLTIKKIIEDPECSDEMRRDISIKLREIKEMVKEKNSREQKDATKLRLIYGGRK